MSDYVADFKFFIEYPNLIDYSKFFKNPIVICIIIFILALIGVGIYFIFIHKKTKPNGGGGSGGGSGGGGGPTGPTGGSGGGGGPTGPTGGSGGGGGPTGPTGGSGPSSNCKDSNCTSCIGNWNPSTKCTSCIDGWDPEQSCTICLNTRGPGPNSLYQGENKCGLFKQLTSTNQWFITGDGQSDSEKESGCFINQTDDNCVDYFSKYGAKSMNAVNYCRYDDCCRGASDRLFCTTTADWYTNMSGNVTIENPTCDNSSKNCSDLNLQPNYDAMGLWIDG